MREKQEVIVNKLSASTLAKISKIFTEKKWPIDDSDLEDKHFEMFCCLLGSLNEQEKDVILTLTEEFLWIRCQDYFKYFIETFDLFLQSLSPSDKRTITILPLLRENDFGKTKSSHCLFYQIEAGSPLFSKRYPSRKIGLNGSPQTFLNQAIPNNSCFCLVDDFIGSGETADDAIKYLIDKGVDKSDIVVLSLVAMRQGVDYLLQKGYIIFAAHIKSKAITGRTDINELYFGNIMRDIEKRIKVKKSFEFGYARSEALVKMMRTPNNTFPVYWYNKHNPNAPFPRG